MNKIYLLLGSNIGNSKKQLSIAIKFIRSEIGKTVRKSAIYQTAAWGNRDQPDFLNQVIIAETKLDAAEAIQIILSIEKKMGRIRTTKNAPRIIDIDILFFNKDVIDTSILTVPHPQIQNRRFVLIPLNELSPNFIHPVLQKSLHTLLLNCKDELNVKKF
jgi:2-amino-4-hydroxy-6-hydroxymethyldihydropteridine diphosphokinase